VFVKSLLFKTIFYALFEMKKRTKTKKEKCQKINKKWKSTMHIFHFYYLKFGDGDGPNLCRVKK